MEEDEWYAQKKKKAAIELPRNLERLSVAELDEYALLLDAEKARVAQEKKQKQSALGAADALFKKSST